MKDELVEDVGETFADARVVLLRYRFAAVVAGVPPPPKEEERVESVDAGESGKDDDDEVWLYRGIVDPLWDDGGERS